MAGGRASKRQKLAGGKSAPKKGSASSKAKASKAAVAKAIVEPSDPVLAPTTANPPPKALDAVTPTVAPSTDSTASPVVPSVVKVKNNDIQPAAKEKKARNVAVKKNESVQSTDVEPSAKPKPKVSRKRPLPKEEYVDIWEDVYFAGTEWTQIEEIMAEDWDFEHLDDALTSGELSGKMVHLFGASEPQLIMRDEKDTKGSVIPVPVIIAVESSVPPPETIGVNSVQRTEEEIIPMSTLKMGWHPYVPDNLAGSRRFKPRVHVLKCEQRRARLRNMTEAAVHKYDYVLPYLIRPGQEDDITLETEIQVLVDLEGHNLPHMMSYDFELDDIEEFVEEQVKDNELDPEKHTEALKKAIRDQVRATKLKFREDKAARQKRIDDIPQEHRDAMKAMRILKFYPQNDWPDVSNVKSRYINRYYGQADKVL